MSVSACGLEADEYWRNVAIPSGCPIVQVRPDKNTLYFLRKASASGPEIRNIQYVYLGAGTEQLDEEQLLTASP